MSPEMVAIVVVAVVSTSIHALQFLVFTFCKAWVETKRMLKETFGK